MTREGERPLGPSSQQRGRRTPVALRTTLAIALLRQRPPLRTPIR